MQRQQINSDADSNIESNLNKQHSRSVRKLYNRIGNNIRVLNKSRVSNRSNNSIGSVALRRTELSNDKIYSREQDFLVNDSREIDFQSEINNIRGSINSNTKNEQSSSSNNNKYRQRIKLSKQSFSRRSSSQKSYRQNQGIVKKPTKHQIEKLFMMEDQNINNAGYTKQYNLKRDNFGSKQNYQKNNRIQENYNNRKDYKQSVRSSRQRQQQSNSNTRSYKLMKSSLKSNIKSSKNLSRQSKDIYNRNYYHPQSQISVNGSQMEKLSRKYNQSKNKNQQFNININVKNQRKHREKYQDDNNYQLRKHIDTRPSQYQIQRNKKQYKNDYYYAQKQQFLRQIKQKELRDYKKKQKLQAIQRENSRQRQKQTQYHKLQRYKSQKYMSTNDSEIMSSKRESKNQKERYYKESQKLRERYQNKPKQSSKQRYLQRQLQPQNSLQKYQHEQWTREQNRRHAKENHKHISEKLLLMEQQSVFQDKRENKYNRQKYKHQNDRQRSSILLLRSKNNDSQFRKDIRIKQKEYAYLYGRKQSDFEDQSRVRRSSKKLSYKINSQSSRIKSPMSPRTPKNYQQNEYYAHMMTPGSAASKNYLSVKHSPTTQISSTLDSLLLSINSHISLSQDERSSTSALIDKLNLHIKTLQIISDYSKEFKKMYEDIDQWQELIFLSYKKYWVERVKVIEYLKKFFVPSKRHSSQKINLKVPSSNKNGKDQPLSSPIIEDPFSSNSLLQNPFIIPFCKLSQEQLNKLSRSPQISKILTQLDQETSQVYKHLQQLYNQFITKCHNPNMNMLYCDNFSDEIYLQMLTEIQKLLPNLEQFKMFEVTKIRLGKIVKAGILMLHMNGKYVRNISQILMFDDCEKIGQKKKIKAFTTYDLYYEVFEKLVVE